ncbi:MAG: DUF3575 domain-containing protein [Kofleriaceae bacterium]|nr:DUF3575 domain-containing protein [Kofleriaceae bacterium]MCB9571349.1 DUF3575 domain-containing protein [Kofleriaceae bacterium]
MTHLATRTVLASLALAAVAAPAVAQPATTAAAIDGSAPAAADGGGAVNTLNDQLVPVGDNNRYQHGYKKYNVSTNPLGWVFGSYGVSGSYAVHENVAVRADVNYYAPPGDLDISGFSVGIGAPIYFRKVYSGVFLEPGFQMSRVDCGSCTDAATVAGPNIQVGYHWYWDSGLNVAVALGAGRNWNSKSDDPSYDGYDDIYATGYLRFGYAF